MSSRASAVGRGPRWRKTSEAGGSDWLPRLPLRQAPDLLQAHRLVADVVIPDSGAEGALLAAGGRWGGSSCT